VTAFLGVLALLVAISAHELGHLLPGLAMGQRFVVFAAGPVRAPGRNVQYAFASLNTRATVRNRIRTSNHSDQFCT
jgi:hypothetical protein